MPQSEAPAYFEWILWRAFLAINSLNNKPYDARRFNIDQDFLPVGTAPGNRPDLIFEFHDSINFPVKHPYCPTYPCRC
ncbi:MAG: AlwI family type II restriction endonuclease [Chlorobium sp.]